MNKRYYWLKLHDDYFENANIKIIEDMDNGPAYLLFLFKLKLISVKTEGYLRVTDTLPYNEKTLATVTNSNVDLVRTAMKIFQEFDLIEILPDDTIYVKCIELLIGSESEVAERVRKHRAKQKALHGNKVKQISNTDIELDSELDSEKEIKKEYNEHFDKFWAAYPRKIGKKATWHKWVATLKRVDFKEYEWVGEGCLIYAALSYAERCKKAKTDEQYIWHPATFLGPDEHWRDFVRKSDAHKRNDGSADGRREAEKGRRDNSYPSRKDGSGGKGRVANGADKPDEARGGRWQMPKV